MQTSRYGPNAIEPRRSEDEASHRIVIPNQHIQSTIGLALPPLRQRTPLRCRTRKGFEAFVRAPTALLAITHTDRASGGAIKQGVFGPEAQRGLIEHQANRD